MERRQAYGRHPGMWKAGRGSQSQTDAEFMSHNRHKKQEGRERRQEQEEWGQGRQSLFMGHKFAGTEEE